MGSPENMTSPGRRRYLRPHRILVCHFLSIREMPDSSQNELLLLLPKIVSTPNPCLLSSRRLWLVQSYSDQRVCRFQLHHSRYSSILSRLDQQQLTPC